jgi:ribosomal protein L22
MAEEEKPKRRRTRRKVDEIEPTPSDVEAADEAADVVLEAEAEIDEDSEPEADDSADEEVEAPAEEADAGPARRPRRRRAAAEPEEEAPKPAPTRRRRPARDPNLPPPVVRAQAKYVRSSARKARLVCDPIRGKSVEEARAILAYTPRAVARDWSKLLESAIANAENNHELVGEDLYIKAIHADQGPTIKRFRPRAMGRATRIRKRTSHLTILLTPKE